RDAADTGREARPMTYRIIITARARADAIEAFRWMLEKSPTAAARWYAGLEKAIAKLNQNPERHPGRRGRVGAARHHLAANARWSTLRYLERFTFGWRTGHTNPTRQF